MSDSDKTKPDLFKIASVTAPLVASSLALTYDVGFFVGIGSGFFTFFTLAEHLVFALQSLPFFILPASILLSWVSSAWFSYRWGYKKGRTQAEKEMAAIHALPPEARAEAVRALSREFGRPNYLEMVLATLIGAGIGLLAWSHFYLPASLLFGLFLFVLHGLLPRELSSNRVLAFAAATILLLTCSFAIGVQRAESISSSTKPQELITTVDGEISAILIRGGDKGVLFFAVSQKRVQFVRWDAIKQIQTN